MAKSLYTTLLLMFLLVSGARGQMVRTPVSYVDPFIGSVNCRWFFFTPAALPFGMARLGPETNAHYGSPHGWEPIGYDDHQHSIEGFGHFHEFQIGGLIVMPTVGKLITVPGDLNKPDSGYRSRFDKNTEVAKPGYYSVFLKDYGIKVELTATKRVGFHRYTFPATDSAHVLFDVGNRQGESGPVLHAGVHIINDHELAGTIITLPDYVRTWDSTGRVKMYFYARFNRPFTGYGAFIHRIHYKGKRSIRGVGCGMYCSFNTRQNKEVELKVGLSYTSIANAKRNLDGEADHLSFDQCKKQALNTWNNYLGKIEVAGKNDTAKTKFYTGLYHALSGRGISSDLSGAYPKPGGGIGHIPLGKNGRPLYNHYNSDASWGIFWNLLPLWGLVYPNMLDGFVRSYLDWYKDIGWLPDGVAAGALSPGMPSNFTGLTIVSAYQRGIRNYNIDTAWAAVRKNELDWHHRPIGVGKYDLKDFVTLGYVPIENTFNGYKFSASHTLEYAFSSWAAGQMAKSLGKMKDYHLLNKMGHAYRNIFDTTTKMMRPRHRNGQFIKNFDPSQVWNGFQEGNSWQYSWYVPQDVDDLIRLIGKNEFNKRLDSIFKASKKNLFGGGKNVNSFSGLQAVYNQGNQPSLDIAYLFNYSGKPWLTQKWVREIMNTFYGVTPLHGYGYGQDEDQGQLGAWYVLAALGLFDVQGGVAGNPVMQITTPIFDSITIHLDPRYYPGKEIEILTDGNNKQNVYIQSARFNGRKLRHPWIDFNRLVKGGKLEYRLGSEPNKAAF
ncbi:MAG TPA: GH92 family glycosyl hydrolase [Chitinophagaceae bacterium]|nr:GH92 family glycosyl hydrolase [Chitinophagaceae bacterium]